MPRRPDPADVTDRVPGLYRYLIEREQRDHDSADPRLHLVCTPEQWDAACTEAAIQPPSGMLADLLAGRPATVPAWVLRGRTFGEAAQRIPWLAEARDVMVHADDTITVA
jgi:hypothetical protein